MELNKDEYSERLVQILKNYYTNKEFLKSIINIFSDMSSKHKMRETKNDLAIILKYYIMSRDTKAYDSYQDIFNKYNNIHHFDITRGVEGLKEHRRKYDELCDNIENYGYITHSFYGKEGEYLRKYGLNYIAHLSQEEYEEYINAKYALYGLIDYFHGATYSEEYIDLFNYFEEIPISRNERIYFSTPGDTTFLYTIGHSPASLYEGPLNHYSDYLDISSTNSKKSAIKHILQERVENAYFESDLYPEKEDTEFIKHHIETIVNFYCTGLPGFALVKIADVKQRNICFGIGAAPKSEDFKYDFDALVSMKEEEIIEEKKNRGAITREAGEPRKSLYYPRDFWSSESYFPTRSIFANFCAESKDLDGIPVYCVPCFDEYDIIKLIKEMENPESAIRSKK